mmetsp:Transcript_67535/g.187136  ORF Transcript_67535/g.187136 Transcript_67535/m.187136 type:complete len:255 (+) Transcript_67535:352-1116(+)
MPKLAVSCRVGPSGGVIGVPASLARSRSASRTASSGRQSAARMTNSSPPWRASSSPSRTSERASSAVARNTASPTGWPCRSLTCLKWSRSKTTRATAQPWRRACASSPAARSTKARRFGRPVRKSVSLATRSCSISRSRSSSSARLRSIASRSAATARCRSPISSRRVAAGSPLSGRSRPPMTVRSARVPRSSGSSTRWRISRNTANSMQSTAPPRAALMAMRWRARATRSRAWSRAAANRVSRSSTMLFIGGT